MIHFFDKQTCERVIIESANAFGVPVEVLMVKDRRSFSFMPRAVAMYILRSLHCSHSFIVGLFPQHRNHTTSVNAFRFVRDRLECKERGFERLPEIIKTIEEKAGLCAGPKTN